MVASFRFRIESEFELVCSERPLHSQLNLTLHLTLALKEERDEREQKKAQKSAKAERQYLAKKNKEVSSPFAKIKNFS